MTALQTEQRSLLLLREKGGKLQEHFLPVNQLVWRVRRLQVRYSLRNNLFLLPFPLGNKTYGPLINPGLKPL